MSMMFMGCRRALAYACALPVKTGQIALVFMAAFFWVLAAEPAAGQSPSAPLPPFQQVDDNGVDLVSGAFSFAMQEGSVGSGEANLSLMRYWAGNTWTDNWTGGLYVQTTGGVPTYYVNLGAISDSFILSGSTFLSNKANGATLQQAGLFYNYVSSSGVKITFRTQSDSGYPLQGYSCPVTAVGACYIPISVTQPNGMIYTINWNIVEKCNQSPQQPDCPGGGTGFFRFAGVRNTPSYSFSVSYLTNVPGSGTAPQTNWYKRTGVAFGAPGGCGSACPALTYSTTGPLTITDALGRIWRFTTTGSGITGIKRPGSASADTTTVTYGAAGVTNLTRDGVSWTYNRVVGGTTSTMTVTDALANHVTIIADLTKYRVTSYTDQLLHTTSYGYDANARPTLVTAPEGNSTGYHYDARGNIDIVTNTAKSGSPKPTIVTTSSYPTTCPSPITCNEPDWTRDAKGNQTDYIYDSGTGLVTSVTAPAPSAGAVRPQARYSYTAFGGVSLLTGVSACQTGATCAGTADEAKTAIGYNVLLEPTSVSKGAGDGSLTATTAMTYDIVGNLLTLDGPLPGTGDTSVYHYDLDRELVGIVGPDPDGTGALKPRAVRITYNADGQATMSERGTVVDQSDPAWAAFNSLQQQSTSYDANARAVQATATAGGTTYTLQQYSYDALGRLDCSATRLSAPPVASTPVCTPNSAASSDMITRTTYDAVGRVANVTTGYGVSPRTLFAYGYTANGRVQTVADGNANLTTYAYDIFDRLWTTSYPNKTGGGSSTTDQEILLYDANSNVIDRQLRNAAHILYAYDNLNRLTGKTLPAGNANLNPSFTYDNLNRPITANNGNGVYSTAITYGYDALSRKTSEADGLNGTTLTKTMQYDLAGRRIRLTWPDAFFVNYDYDFANDMTAVRENGATSGVGLLATFAYDDLGQRTTLTRGNGTVTSYGYDSGSRLTGLVQDLTGFGNDQTLGFGYDSANRITQRTNSNDAYAWPAPATPTSSFPVNGLNQYTPTAAGQTTVYDPRGNLIQLGSATYSYSAENELALTGTSNRFYYDAMHRLLYSTAVSARYDRDGWDLIGLYNASNTLSRRYVFGPDPDEPLMWYEGSGTTDRRWLHADERGSITAITNSGGGALYIDSYDEYGVPASTNGGRFQYTGQAWQSELGMYYYKSRMYVPSLGRFAQTDPIGYDGGPNLYAYTGNDPVNFSDPLGLKYRWACAGTNGDNCGWVSDGGYTGPLPVSSGPSSNPGSGSGGGTHGAGHSSSQDDNHCPPVPTHPSGASIDANIKTAQSRNSLNSYSVQTPYGGIQPNLMNGPRWFYSQVDYGGPWDYKTKNPIGTQRYTDFGNFNYGATGRAAGFSANELLWGAGLAQLKHDLGNWQWPQGPGTRFDNPDDAAPILAGIEYYDNGCFKGR